MVRFFVNRPIVAIVISIITVMVGLLTMVSLPVSLYPQIAPPEIQIQTTYVGANAKSVEESVATPIEQKMSGVDNMNYMFSINASNGSLRMTVNFDVKTDPNLDLVLSQMRESQADSQLPPDVRNFGVTVIKSTATPLMLVSLYAPHGDYDATFLANYAYIHIADAMSQVPGVGSVQVFGAGQYAMRIWVDPDKLAKLQITVLEVIAAINDQSMVNPGGQIGAEPAPPGQPFTYTVVTQGRLVTAEQFGQIIIRANTDGSIVRIKDVGRCELGAQVYTIKGRLDGQPAANLAVYQLPGSNAVQTAQAVRELMDKLREQFPPGLEYTVSLDTTRAVSAGMEEIVLTLFEALGLVAVVVFLFLQGWRATLIPLAAVPVSLIGTFAVFPLLGFSINTLSLFGLVLAIGLVVDDAIVVVEAVERKIEQGLPPREATLAAMSEVSSAIVAIALILAAVFLPTVFLPGITGRLYQQFALTIAVSVILSAFNALTLSPALAAMLLRPRAATQRRKWNPLAFLFVAFNKLFDRVTSGYVRVSGVLIRRVAISLLLLAGVVALTAWTGRQLPGGFLTEEDQGYMFVNLQLPPASSLQRTDEATRAIEKILAHTPGVEHFTTVVGFSLLSTVQSTYNAFFFVTLKEWRERTDPAEQYQAIQARINEQVGRLPDGISFAFSPPAIPGVGRSGGVTFILQDRAARGEAYLATNLARFLELARKRTELANVTTVAQFSVPQVRINVDDDKAYRQGVPQRAVYQTLATFMGGNFVNYFNRFGRQWQVYVQAEGSFRTRDEELGRYYVRNSAGQMLPLTSVVSAEPMTGPEFTMRFNEYGSAQINAAAAPGYSSAEAMAALEEVFDQNMPRDMGYDYMGMSFQEKVAQKGVSPIAVYALSLAFVFLILAAQYESWSLPFSVLLVTPVAVLGAFATLLFRRQFSPVFENNVYTQIGIVMLIGLSAKNAILIVQFARVELERGRSIVDAALAAARLRLRPIVMTSLAMVVGLLPLWFATGAGAVARRALGTAVIGGLLAATFIAVFLVPFSFCLVEGLMHRLRRHHPPANPAPSGTDATA